MINVIPDKGRADIRKEYLFRLVTLCASAFGLSALIAVLVLSPLYFGERTRRAVDEANLATLEASAQREAEGNSSQDLSRVAEELPLLEEKLASPRPTLFFASLVSAQNAAVQIHQLEFTGGESPAMRVIGNARTREALTSFSRALSGLPGKPVVDLPVSYLTKSEDAPFTLTLHFKK